MEQKATGMASVCPIEFKLFTNMSTTIVDQENFNSSSFVDVKANVCIIPPNSFALACVLELSNTTPQLENLCERGCGTRNLLRI